MRACLAPLQVLQSKSIAKMAIIRPQMDKYSTIMREAPQKGTPKAMNDAEQARVDLQKLFAKHGVRPWMTMVGALGQMPLWISFFFTMRHLVREGADMGLETGGTLWFTDLTQSDPYYVLPICMGGSFYYMVALGDAGTPPGAPVDERQATMKSIMKVAAVAMIPATYWFPTGVYVYWITTNVATISQTHLLRMPLVREAAGLPALPTYTVPPPTSAQSAGMLGAMTGVLPQRYLDALGIEPPPVVPVIASAPAPREFVDATTSISLQGSKVPSMQSVVVPAKAAKKGKRGKRRR